MNILAAEPTEKHVRGHQVITSWSAGKPAVPPDQYSRVNLNRRYRQIAKAKTPPERMLQIIVTDNFTAATEQHQKYNIKQTQKQIATEPIH